MSARYRVFLFGTLLLFTVSLPASADNVTSVCQEVDTDFDGIPDVSRCQFTIEAEGGDTTDFHINIGETGDSPVTVSNFITFNKEGPGETWMTSVTKPKRCESTNQECNGDPDCGGAPGSCLTRWCEGGINDALGCIIDANCPGGTCTGSVIFLNWFAGTADAGDPISSGSSSDNFEVDIDLSRGTSGNPTKITSDDADENHFDGRKTTTDANGLDAFDAEAMAPVLNEAAGGCLFNDGGCLPNTTREGCRRLGGTFDLGLDCRSEATVPLLPPWGMALLVILLAGGAFFVFRRVGPS